MTLNPAKIFNLKGRGSLKEGSIADITIIDTKYNYEFSEKSIVSKSKNSPFIGRRFKGGAVMTIVAGNVVWQK
jgi:dihydroorotase